MFLLLHVVVITYLYLKLGFPWLSLSNVHYERIWPLGQKFDNTTAIKIKNFNQNQKISPRNYGIHGRLATLYRGTRTHLFVLVITSVIEHFSSCHPARTKNRSWGPGGWDVIKGNPVIYKGFFRPEGSKPNLYFKQCFPWLASSKSEASL